MRSFIGFPLSDSCREEFQVSGGNKVGWLVWDHEAKKMRFLAQTKAMSRPLLVTQEINTCARLEKQREKNPSWKTIAKTIGVAKMILCEENPTFFVLQRPFQMDLFVFMQTEHKEVVSLFPKIISCVLAALQIFNKLDLVHGDIKPENLLVRRSRSSAWQFAITDFGSAHFHSDIEEMTDKEVVDKSRMIGTPLFLAPELEKHFHGSTWTIAEIMRKIWNPKIDLWSFGMTLCNLIVGLNFLFFEKQKYHYSEESTCERELRQCLVDLQQHQVTRYLEEHIRGKVSNDIYELLQQLLIVDQENRPSLQQLQEDSRFRHFFTMR